MPVTTALCLLVKKALYAALLGHARSLELDNANHKQIAAARDKLKSRLVDEYHANYFFGNLKWLVPGILISILTITGLAIADLQQIMLVGVPILITSVFSFSAIRIWRQGKRLFAVIILGIAGVVTLAELSFMSITFDRGLVFVPILVFLLGINCLFYFLLKAPTRLGRNVMDEIQGFKKYLSTAETNRLNTLASAEENLALFEKFLPYALALDVDQEWSEHFSAILEQAARDPDNGSTEIFLESLNFIHDVASQPGWRFEQKVEQAVDTQEKHQYRHKDQASIERD